MGTLGDGNGDGGAGGPDAKKDDIYENRPGHKKIIRVVTVMAYMVSVSFVAIVLSAYYVFLWQPPNPRLMHRSHLRADPQVEYLVHGAAEDVPQDGVDDLKRVIVLGEKISVGSERDESPERAKSLKVGGVDPRAKEANEIGDDRRTSARAWNPIVRALLATTENPGVETLADSTGVYESPGATVKSSLKTESSNSEINGSRTRGPASDSMTIIRGIVGEEFYGLGNYSDLVIERGDKLYEESVNYSTPIDLDNLSEETGDDFGRGFGDAMGRRANESLENSGNFTPEVQPIPTGYVETSGKSRPAEAQPEMLGTTASFGSNVGESMGRRAKESLENSGNFTPEVQWIPTGTVETSGKSRPTQTQTETLSTTASFGPNFGESTRMSSTNFPPEVQPIPIGTVATFGKSRPTQTQTETLSTTANFGQNFGESTRTSSTNFPPEVQPIPIGLKERSVSTVATSGKSRPAQAQPETLGTTAASDQQRGLDWKPLAFTVRPAKLGSPITRVEAKSPINDTESVGKFSSALEANEDVPIEMIAGPAGDAELASEQSASAVPALVQPEPDYVDK